MREANHAQGGQLATALGERDARVVIDDAKRDDGGESEVDGLDQPDARGGGFAEVRAERFLHDDPAHARLLLQLAEEFLPARAVHAEARAGDDVAFAEQTVQRAAIHVGDEAGEIFAEADERHVHLASSAFEELHGHLVAELRAEHFGELRGNDHSLRRHFDDAIVRVDHALMNAVPIHALDGKLAMTLAEMDSREGVAERLDAHHAGQLPERMLGGLAVRLDEADAHVLALHGVPLELEDLPDAVAETVRDDENPGGQREPGDGEEDLHRLAFEIADGDAEGVREKARDAGAFDEGRTIICRRLGAHGFGGRQLGGATNGVQHAQRRGKRGDDERSAERRVIELEAKFREAEEHLVHLHELRAEEDAAERAEDGSADDEGEGELEVVKRDVAIRKAERLEDGDLVALQREQAREHGVGHEGGDAEEDEREAEGEDGEHADFVRHADVRRMIRTTVRAASTVAEEQAIQFGDDGMFTRAGREREHDGVERAVEIVGVGELLVGHPENAVGAVVRQGGAGARFEDVFRREHDAGEARLLEAAVDDHRDGVAGLEMVRLGEGFANEDFAATTGLQPFAGAEEEAVQLRLAKIGNGTDEAGGGLVEAGDVERDLDGDARLDGGDTGNFADAFGERERGALKSGKDVGEAVGAVVFFPRALQRMDEAARHDEHGQPARHHERHRDGLAFHAAQVAEEFAVEVGEHVTSSNSTPPHDSRCGGCDGPCRRRNG